MAASISGNNPKKLHGGLHLDDDTAKMPITADFCLHQVSACQLMARLYTRAFALCRERVVRHQSVKRVQAAPSLVVMQGVLRHQLGNQFRFGHRSEVGRIVQDLVPCRGYVLRNEQLISYRVGCVCFPTDYQ